MSLFFLQSGKTPCLIERLAHCSIYTYLTRRYYSVFQICIELFVPSSGTHILSHKEATQKISAEITFKLYSLNHLQWWLHEWRRLSDDRFLRIAKRSSWLLDFVFYLCRLLSRASDRYESAQRAKFISSALKTSHFCVSRTIERAYSTVLFFERITRV